VLFHNKFENTDKKYETLSMAEGGFDTDRMQQG